MGQVLHGSATTTHAIRAAIQRSKAPTKELAARYSLNRKTVAKWRKRSFLHDAPMGPKAPRSTVLTPEEEAIAVAFRKHTLLPLDDCLYALQATIPHLTRSALHRWLSRQAFKLDGGEAAVHALTVAFPNVAGVGLPVLVCAFGPKAALPVAIGIAAGAITISPLTLALLEIAKSGQAETAGAAVGPFDTFLAALGRSLRRPIFLGPALGVLVSALGVTPPPLLAASLGPVTACTAGVGLFLTGLMFSAQAIRLNGR